MTISHEVLGGRGRGVHMGDSNVRKASPVNGNDRYGLFRTKQGGTVPSHYSLPILGKGEI